MIKSAAKYFVVGGIGTITHFGLLYLIVEFLLLAPVLGSSIAFVWVVIQSYFLNKNWTFQSDKDHLQTLPRYIAVSCLGFVSNLFIMYMLVNVFELWYMLAQASTIIVIPAMNFLLNRYWTFSS